MYYLDVRDPVEKVFTIPELRLIILSYALEDKIEPKKKYSKILKIIFFFITKDGFI